MPKQRTNHSVKPQVAAGNGQGHSHHHSSHHHSSHHHAHPGGGAAAAAGGATVLSHGPPSSSYVYAPANGYGHANSYAAPVRCCAPLYTIARLCLAPAPCRPHAPALRSPALPPSPSADNPPLPPTHRPQKWDFARRFPGADPMAIDLMLRMLQFDPRKRISVQDALRHLGAPAH